MFLRTAVQFEPGRYELLNIIRPLYALTEVCPYWQRRFSEQRLLDLHTIPSTEDLSIFYKLSPMDLTGVLATHVLDTLGVAYPSFTRDLHVI